MRRQYRISFFIRKLCFLIFLFISVSTTAQTPYLKHFTVENGLPSSKVYTAFQDDLGMMWFGTDKGITRFDGYSFEDFNMSSVNAATDIWGIYKDIEGRLWFSSQRQLTYLENGVFKAIPFPKGGNYTTIKRQYFDKKGNHFIYFDKSKMLYQVDIKQHRLIPFEAITVENTGHWIHFFQEDEKERKWFLKYIGNKIEFLKYENGKVDLVNTIEILFTDHINPLQLDKQTYLFLNNKGNVEIDVQKGTMKLVENPFAKDFSMLNNRHLINNLVLLNTEKGYQVIDKKLEIQEKLSFINQFLINDLYEDKHGNIWICTDNDGLYFLPKQGLESQSLQTTGVLAKDDITALVEDKKGRIWFANKNLDLQVIQENGQVHTINFNLNKPLKENVFFDDLAFDADGNFYIASNQDLLIIVPHEKVEMLLNKNVLNIKQQILELPKTADNLKTYNRDLLVFKTAVIKSILVNGNEVYLTSSNLTFQLNFENDFRVKKVDEGRAYAAAIWQDKLWIGRKDLLYNMNTRQNKQARPYKKFPFPINALLVDKADKFWIATDGNGLYRYDGEKTDTIKEFLDTRITINDLYADNDNQLWVSTNKGVGLISKKSNQPFRYEFKMITKAYGLISDEVNQVLIKNNKIYVATSRGLTILTKENLNRQTEKQPLFFTNLWVNNEKINFNNELVFSYKENNLKIEYLCLSYSNLGNIEYQYSMEGVDKSWQRTPLTFKEYSTLQPGTYTFKVRATNLTGVISEEKTITIKIKLPWWRTSIAWLSFAVLLGLATYGFFEYRLRQEKQRQEKQRLEELNQLKSRFYANITHEFRTPLTLIMGLTQQLKTTADKQTIASFEVIERHSYRLLNLINQLLDLNKLESKAMPLHYQHGDIISFCKYIVGLFESAAKNKSIQLTFYAEIEALRMDFDADKIQSILFNLLSNALKFTESSGQIIVHIQQLPTENQCVLKVKDTGIGISNDALTYIFHRYYQDKTRLQKDHNHTGIGLALVKELVEQMNGEIEVESSSHGTQFTIVLPITQNQSDKTESIETIDISNFVNAYFPSNSLTLRNPQIADETEKPLLLLVEDDVDLMHYLQAIIGQYYEIEMAKDGAEGIEKAIEKVPDLIISDVMMPKKNGFELCQILKNDERTSHIPIILLTAKTSKEDEIKGLKSGANVYMIKPFLQEELFLRINQQLENRQRLQERYQSADLPKIKPVPQIQKEDEFVLKVRQVIEENIDNYALDVAFLCEKLYVSRAQLHKKLTYLTGNSTTKFIKHVRLQKAEKLLRETDLNISEIAYETGFDVKYFSKVFNETYGTSPSNYRKEQLNC